MRLILYSKSVRAIGEDLHVTTEKAQEIYDSVMKAFPTMANWIHESQEKAKRQGYIDGYYGRRRRLPELLLDDYEFNFRDGVDERTKKYYTKLYNSRLHSVGFHERDFIIAEAKKVGIYITDNTNKKAKSMRQIVNSIVQGSSADICKLALILMFNDPILKKYDAKLEMSIHDEQLLSCPEEYAYEVVERANYLAKKAGEKLPIELLTDVAISRAWYGEELTFDEHHKLVPLTKH